MSHEPRVEPGARPRWLNAPGSNDAKRDEALRLGDGNLVAEYGDADVTQDAADDGRQFTYDTVGIDGHLGSRSYRYLYTADDERIGIVEVTGTPVYTWTIRGFGNEILRNYRGTGAGMAWVEDEIWRGGSLLANERPSLTRHYALDHLGSPRALTGSTGTFLGTQDFQPYGAGGTTDGGALQFTGHERDAELLSDTSGSMPDYFHARSYDVARGRFLSVDPVIENAKAVKEPQRWNRYAYVLDNPMNHTDPTGKVTTCDRQNCTTTADTYNPAHSTGQTTVATPEMRSAATAGASIVAVHNGSQEKMGFGVRDAQGNLTVQAANGVRTATTATGNTASSSVPAGAEFVIHGHIDGRSNGMVDDTHIGSGYGDTQSLTLRNPMPTATVSGGQVGWHEILNGQLRFTAPVGALTLSQQQAIQNNLNSEQMLSAFWKP